MTVELSQRTETLLARVFTDEDARAVARTLLTEKCGEEIPGCKNARAEDLERIRFAVLKLSGGDFHKLNDAVELANLDWRDLFMAAGFGHEVQAHERWYWQVVGS